VRDGFSQAWPMLAALVVQSLLLAWWLGGVSTEMETMKEQLTRRASVESVQTLSKRVDRIDARVPFISRGNR